MSPIKDQGICGSCWSFGTTGTIEGAYFVKVCTDIDILPTGCCEAHHPLNRWEHIPFLFCWFSVHLVNVLLEFDYSIRVSQLYSSYTSLHVIEGWYLNYFL